MGIVISDITFTAEVPSLEAVCSEMEAVCGLRVVIVENHPGEFDDFNASIAFACDPDFWLKVCDSRPNRFIRSNQNANQHETGTANRARNIQLTGYVGQDLTLLMTATLALESLGGEPAEPISDDDRRAFATKISEAELKRRHDAARRECRKMSVFGVLTLPIIVPVVMSGAVCSLVGGLARMCWTKRLLKKG